MGLAHAGPPERGHTRGVEVTTGPLGQGFANAVGMAIAEANLRARFGTEVCDHHTYMICSDGDLMEGISHEAASLAGHLGLGRLIAVYDDNHITIDGPTEIALTDDAAARFRAYGWHVEEVGEIANDLDALEAALLRAKAVEDRPSMIVLRSHIAWPAPNKVDTPSAHGEPLGADEIAATKTILGMDPNQTFAVPAEVLRMYHDAARRHASAVDAWSDRVAALPDDRRAELDACLAGLPMPGWADRLPTWKPGDSVATRQAPATASTPCSRPCRG